MASLNWIETIFGARRRPASARPRRERDDWYIPLEIGRLEERRVLNVAPVLAGANNLATVHQNQPAASNAGTTVAALIAGKVTDPDPGALSGIAVTAVDNTNGTWQFSTNSGGLWTDFGSPTNSNARLLAADATTYIRFLPNAEFNGTVSPGVTFRAWDQTSGSAGGTADASSNGGTTAFSLLTASSNITIDQPITITGTTTTSITDKQTANPFSGVTIGDSISAVENITVLLTQSSTANGAVSNLGGFIDNNDGTFTFTGTAAAATTALQGLLFTPTVHQVAPGGTVDTTFTIRAADAMTSTTDANSMVHVTAANTAPTLTGANDLTAIQQDDKTSNGTLVSALIAGKASDSDFGQTLGIAITATDETHGTWEYTTDGGSNWQGVGNVVNAHALLLAADANTRIRFVPDAGFSGPVTNGITFRAWDGFTGTAGNFGNTNSNGGTTAYSSATASSSLLINDAPTLTGANDLTSINENDTTSAGTLVSALISGKASDVNGNPLGIAVTGVDSTNGTWEYSTNGGTNWTNIGSPTAGAALLLTGDASTRVRFVPAANFFGTSSITFQAWDETSGSAGGTADATVNGGTTAFSTASATSSIKVDAPPSITGAGAKSIDDNQTTNPFSNVIVADPDSSSVTVTVTQTETANGSLSNLGGFVDNGGGSFTFTGTAAAATAALQNLLFTPTANQVIVGATIDTHFTIVADDGVTSATDTNTVVHTTSINDAPMLTAGQVQPLTTITEDDVNNGGNTVASLLGTAENDVDFGAVQGIAITDTTVVGSGLGRWQFSTDGGTSWSDIGSVSDGSALLLRSTDRIRFLPDAKNGDTGTITFRAWDQTGSSAGQEGTKADTSTNGGTTPYSAAKGTSDITVQDVNDAPVLAPGQTQPLTTITEDDVTNPGNTVASLLGTAVSDVDTGAVQGIAITATSVSGSGQGRWQFSIDGGTSWSDIGVVSDGSALLLRSTDLVRFLPDAKNGNTGTITFRAWDQTGSTAGQEGTKVSTSINGGTRPFSAAKGTSDITVQDVNDAPVLTPGQVQPFNTITEDDVNNPGNTIASLLGTAVSDADNGAIKGIAITDATIAGNGQGRWQYSTDGGTSWSDIGAVSDSSALLLRSTDRVRFLPDAKNGNTGTITFRAWDQTGATTGQEGTMVDTATNGGTSPFSTAKGTSAITVQDVNDAPVLVPGQTQPLTTITEDDVTNPGNTVASLLGTAVSDVDTGAIQGIAITATSVSGSGQGRWQFSTDGGTSWSNIGVVADGSALLLRSTDLVRFLPDAKNGNTGTITFRAWDQSGLTAGQEGTKVSTSTNGGSTPFSAAKGTSDITVQDVNDAPALTPGQVQPFTTITEDDVNNPGNTVASLLGTAVSDVDTGAIQGIAITATSVSGNGQGRWQFSIDGGSNWSDIGAVSDNSALLLRATDRVRFLPDAKNGNTGTITFRAWDQSGVSAGQQGSLVDASLNGGTTPFSTAQGTSAITVQDVNDAPVLVPGQTQQFTTITEDDISNPGNTVASLLAASVSDVDTGAVQGIAIIATSVTGTRTGTAEWQFSIDGGLTWSNMGAVSDSSALVLRSTDLVRILPDQANGNTFAITYRAWDRSGAAIEGTKVNATLVGGIAPYSVATATGTIVVEDRNDAPAIDPQTVFLPVSAVGSTGALNGSAVSTPWIYTEKDSPLQNPAFAWAITAGNNGAFAIDPASGAVSVANVSLYSYSAAPIVLTITATESQFAGAAAIGTQSLTIQPWMITTSATQINNQQATTLTINLNSGAAHSFTGTITWGDESQSGKSPQVVTMTSNTSMQISHTYLQNPNTANAAQPIPIAIDFVPTGEPSAVHATSTTAAPVPGNVFAAVKVTEIGGSSFTEAPRAEFSTPPPQTTSPLSSISQTTAAGASASESTNTDERLVALRLVSPSEAEGKDVVISDPRVLMEMIGSNRAFKVDDAALNDLPALFKRLPDGRYQIYLAEEGHLRLVIDVIVRQGRAVDPTDDSGGRDRPPTGKVEVGHRDPIVEIKAQFQRAINGRKSDVPDAQPIDSNFAPDGTNWFVVPVGPATTAAAAAPRTGSPAARLERPADGRAPARQSEAQMHDKNHWAAPATAASAAVAVGAGAVLSREERIDQAMQQLDPRSLSKGARIMRWLKKSR